MYTFFPKKIPILFIIFILVAGKDVYANDVLPEPWEITADRVKILKESEDFEAEGNVVLKRTDEAGKPLLVEADWLRYNRKEGNIEARGNVSITSKYDKVNAEKAKFNLDSQSGEFDNVRLFIKDENLYFSGDSIKKTGEKTYRFENGWVSACNTPTGGEAPWSFKCREGKVTIDDFAVLYHTTFQIKDVSVLYTPYIIFPVKTKRESGFLYPEISRSSRDGAGFMAPYFINLSPSADITLYPGYLEKKGVASGVEFRYASGFNSKGSLAWNYLRDKTTDDAEYDFREDGLYRKEHGRYWLRGKIDQEIAEDVVAKLDFERASDRDYIQEYREGLIGYDQSNADFIETFGRGFIDPSIYLRESSLVVGSHLTSSVFGGELRLVDDTRALNNDEALNTLPRLIFNYYSPLGKLPVHVDWENDFVQYRREEGYGYQRFDTHPRFSIPVPLTKVVEGKMTGGVRKTFYRIQDNGSEDAEKWQYDDNNNRTIWDFDINAATVLTRNFDARLGSVRWFNHTIRPNLRYQYVYVENEEKDSKGYYTGDINQTLPDFDSNDRISKNNSITYEINNYFRVGGITSTEVLGGSDDAVEEKKRIAYDRYIGKLKLSQSYDIAEARRELQLDGDERKPFSTVNLDLTLNPASSFLFEYSTAWDIYEDKTTRHKIKWSFNNTRGDSLSFNYNYVPSYTSTPARDLQYSAVLQLTKELSAVAEATQSLYLHTTANSKVGLVYEPHCWSVEIDYSMDETDQRIMVLFSLDGIGKAMQWDKDIL